MMQADWRQLPNKAGIYIFKNRYGKVIYVGKAKVLKKRVANYFSNKALDGKTLSMVSEAASLSHIVVTSEIEAFLLESNLIKKHKPTYNIRLIDDKSYPYLEIAKRPVPYVVLARKKNNLPAGRQGKNAVYLGPYTSVTDLKIVLRLLRRIFPYQSTKNHPKRRCLYSHIGLCPCIPVFPEKLSGYKKNIRDLISFMSGNKDKVLRNLQKEQKVYVKKEEFEKAGDIQRKIEKIGFITSKTYDPFKYEEKPDFYFERIRAEVTSLKEILDKYDMKVDNLHRVECYDISNISGKNATGSMVVFTDGDSSKNGYRKFRIRFKKTPDDFEMMREVMRRRLKHTDWKMPSLMVIDGGRGQVSAVLQVFAEQKINIPTVGLAKKEEVIIIPVRTPQLRSPRQSSLRYNSEFLEIKLPKSTPGVNLLRRIRDEAHRFALHYHRLLRKKALTI